MAITGNDRGTGGNNTGATSLSITPGSNLTAGSRAILVLAYDNQGVNGADPFSSISDSLGNTWGTDSSALYDPAGAGAGVALRIFSSDMAVGTLTTGDSITVSFGAVKVTAKAWTLSELIPTSGYALSFSAAGAGTGAATGTPTVTSSSLASGAAIIGAGGAERADAWTGDSDSSNGSWSTKQSTSFGTGNNGMSVISQRKIVTGTATQTYDPTTTSADCILCWASYTEAPSGTTYTLTGNPGALVLTGNTGSLLAARQLTGNTGALTLTGNTGSLTVGRKLTGQTAALTLTGNTGSLLVSRKLTGQTAALTLTGNDGELTYSAAGGPTYTLTGQTGALTLTGNTGALLAARQLTGQTGALILSAGNATLTYSGAAVEAAPGGGSGEVWRRYPLAGEVKRKRLKKSEIREVKKVAAIPAPTKEQISRLFSELIPESSFTESSPVIDDLQAQLFAILDRLGREEAEGAARARETERLITEAVAQEMRRIEDDDFLLLHLM